MNNNLITLSENIYLTQTHLQTQNPDTIPVSSPSILPTTTVILKSFLHLYHHLILYINLYCKIINHLL